MVTVQQPEEQATCLHEIHKEDFQTENYGVKRRGVVSLDISSILHQYIDKHNKSK